MLMTVDSLLGRINRLNENLDHMTHGDAYDPLVSVVDRCQGLLISLFHSPYWSGSPDWAKYLVLNSVNGDLFWEWHESKPTFSSGTWKSDGKMLVASPYDVSFLCRVSLEEREKEEDD